MMIFIKQLSSLRDKIKNSTRFRQNILKKLKFREKFTFFNSEKI